MSPSTKPLLAFLCATLVSPAFGSIEGTYSGSILTGSQGGGAFSYVHQSTSAKKVGDAGYAQYAGGQVLFAMDNAPNSISFSVIDGDSNGLDDGDFIDLDFTVNLRSFDGSFDNTNTGAVVGTLAVNGRLSVGSTEMSATSSHSSSFTNAIRNITAGDKDPLHEGLSYTIVSGGDTYTGDAFFQSGELAGPFNGVSYDDTTKQISFAIWGNSRNMDANGDPNETGTLNGNANSLGFDIYIEGQIVPEATSLIVWSLLAGFGLSYARRKGSV